MAVQVKGVPAICPDPQFTLLVTGCAATATVADAEAVALPVLESLATLVIE